MNSEMYASVGQKMGDRIRFVVVGAIRTEKLNKVAVFEDVADSLNL